MIKEVRDELEAATKAAEAAMAAYFAGVISLQVFQAATQRLDKAAKAAEALGLFNSP